MLEYLRKTLHGWGVPGWIILALVVVHEVLDVVGNIQTAQTVASWVVTEARMPHIPPGIVPAALFVLGFSLVLYQGHRSVQRQQFDMNWNGLVSFESDSDWIRIVISSITITNRSKTAVALTAELELGTQRFAPAISANFDFEEWSFYHNDETLTDLLPRLVELDPQRAVNGFLLFFVPRYGFERTTGGTFDCNKPPPATLVLHDYITGAEKVYPLSKAP